MRRFLADLLDHLLLVFMMAVVLVFVVLIGSAFKSCSSEEQAMVRAEAREEYEARQEAEYRKLSKFYERIYDKASACYWDLANEYEELYDTYMNDPGRTESLDQFTDPDYLEFTLPDHIEDDYMD